MRLPKREPRTLPTRSELDKRNPRRAVGVALTAAAALVALAATWWAQNGAAFMDELAFRLETIYVYWTLVATPLDRKVWTLILVALVLTVILSIALLHRFVWRALFPDFARLDPEAHAGGRPERLGRLYRVRKFQDDQTERVSFRHYYKHGDRWFPLFRFDYVDLDAPAEPFLFGVSVARCGRLERDPNAPRFKRVAARDPYGSHVLEDDFRRQEVYEDQRRKTNIVGPGPGTNPDVMRRKWQGEHSIMPNIRRRDLAIPAEPPTAPPDPTPPQEESP